MAGPRRTRRRLLETTTAPPTVPAEMVPLVEPQVTGSSVNEIDSANLETTPTGPHSSAASSSRLHHKRGRARGLAVAQETRGGRKILGLRFIRNHLRSLGIKAKHFTRELGSITRAEVSLLIENVKKIEEGDWAKLKSKIVEKFEIEITDETVLDCIYSIVTRAHKTWRYSTKQHFMEKREVSFEEAVRSPPDDVEAVHWRMLCDKYENDKSYQARCLKNHENMKHLKILHTGGSKPFIQIRDEMDGASKIGVYHYTRRRRPRDGTEPSWISPEAEMAYDKMMDLQAQSSADGATPLNADEIYDKVMGTRRGYVLGLGHGICPISSASSRQTSQEVQAELARIREEARIEQAALEARIREEARAEQSALEAHMQEEARLIREEARVEKAALKARMHANKETFEARLKALEELLVVSRN